MCSAQLQGLALTPKIRDLQSEPVRVRAAEVMRANAVLLWDPAGKV